MEVGYYQVIVPQWENSYQKSRKTSPKYWLYKDKDKLPKKHKDLLFEHPLIVNGKAYCVNKSELERFVKNTNKVGKPNLWIVNGQDLYSGTMNWRLRKAIAEYFHTYFSKYIKEQLEPIVIPEGKFLSISCDIYEIKRGLMPDVSNMWILEKFFEDALQDCDIIPDDNPDYVLESGRKKYHWVINPEDRKLIFTIKLINYE